MIKKILIIMIFSIFSSSAGAQMSSLNAHQFSFQTIDGKTINLSDYKGKVILVVNTASSCGFTPQYKDLQQLHQEYGDKGLVVLGIPSRDFGAQEFAEEEKVKKFTSEKFDVTFQLTEICKVKGGDAHPFYKWAKNQTGFFAAPKWNFHKYLIDKNGNLVAWFASTTSPKSAKIVENIEKELKKP